MMFFIGIVLAAGLLVLLPSMAAAQTITIPNIPGQQNTASCGLLSGPIASVIAANEPWYCPISNQVTTQWEKWLPVMLVVTMISFFLAAIIFMVGVALGSAKIRNYGAAEFYEAIATAIIVVGFVYICAVLFGLGPGSFVAYINPYSTAFHLIGSTISNAQNMYSSIYNVNFPLSETVSVTIDIGGLDSNLVRQSFGNAEASAAGTAVFQNIYKMLITVLFLDPGTALSRLLIDGMAVLYGEYYLLVFFSVAAIPVFLIPGIIFRALLPTRGLGGVMIAMAIGFYLIMPTLFATVYFFTAPGLIKDMSLANAQMQGIAVSGTIITSPQSPVVQYLANSQSALSGFWMLVIFYPVMIIAFVYSFVVEISKLIGGTYRATGRLRGFI
jgi:hypothetical protein